MTNYTLGAPFERSGVGLHSGILTTVRVLPVTTGTGRYFVRVDLPRSQLIRATVAAVGETTLSTQLQASANDATDAANLPSKPGDVTVRTVEHILAALAGCGVNHARIEIDGPEVPLLDGSAIGWVEGITEVGVVAVGSQGMNTGEDNISSFPDLATSWVLPEPVWVSQGDAFVAALPAPTIRFTYGIDFEVAAIGNQWYSWTPTQSSFATAIAPARTFGLASQIEELLNRGLIKGGSLENALVCDQSGWLNPPLRFANEPVRHKLLDLVGDLSLLGQFPVAHFLAYKASHNLHIQLARVLAAKNQRWA